MPSYSTDRNDDERPVNVRGRYAPSPTGEIHLGNARTALAAWLSIRKQGGTFVWRLEDIDTPRISPGAAEGAMVDLAWLGLDWDEGPDRGGLYAPYAQSERLRYYEEAMDRLLVAGRLFPCSLSRKDLESLSSAPHGREGHAPYLPVLRPSNLPQDWYAALKEATHPNANIRFKVSEGDVAFDDRVFGRVCERVAEEVGDFVLRRRDGFFAYQLAVVVDDLLMEITEVVRGADLLWSTPRQLQLIEALAGATPVYGHVPLVCNHEGQKLSKRDESLTLAALRGAGIAPEQMTGYLAFSLGILQSPRAIAARELIPLFAWSAIGREDWTLPRDVAAAIASVR